MCLWLNCAELKSNEQCSCFNGYFINVRNTHVCYMQFDFVRIFSQSVRYWYEICNALVPIFHVLWGIGTNSSQCEIYEVCNLRFNRAPTLTICLLVTINWILWVWRAATLSLPTGLFLCFFCDLRFFSKSTFSKILWGISSSCQTVGILIRPNVLLGLIWCQTVCKSYQQTTLKKIKLIRSHALAVDLSKH